MTTLLALSETWGNFIAIAGFVLTLVGFIATLASLFYAIRQIRETKSAAVAAQEAAAQAVAEGRRSFERYAAANAHRLITLAKDHIGRTEWQMAAVRANDLADHVAQLAVADLEWRQHVDDLRTWEAMFVRLARGDLKRFDSGKWIEFSLRLQRKIDSLHAVFPPEEEGNNANAR